MAATVPEFSPVHALDLMSKGMDASLTVIEARLASVEQAVVESNRQMLRAFASLLRDLGDATPAVKGDDATGDGKPPAPTDGGDPRIKSGEPADGGKSGPVDPAKLDKSGKPVEKDDDGDKPKPGDKPARTRRHNFL